MATKITGIDFKAFYYDKEFWPENTYIEEFVAKINGVEPNSDTDIGEIIKDSDIVSVESGYIVDHPDYDGSFVSYYKKWKREQTIRHIVIEIDKDVLEYSITHLKNLGYKIISK
jgi:hypothetical protein